jgi:hypothetical protein
MNLYLSYNEAKYNFLRHFYDDVDHFLKYQQGITYEQLISHFKTKYVFYDFNLDEFSLFDTYLEKTKNDIINVIREAINNSNNTMSLNDIRNYYKTMFPHLEANHILDLETCRYIDNEICDKCGHHWVNGYNTHMVEGMIINDNNNDLSCINVGIFTFDPLIIIH